MYLLKIYIQLWDRVLLCNWECVCKCYCALLLRIGGGLDMTGNERLKTKKKHTKCTRMGASCCHIAISERRRTLYMLFLWWYVFLFDKLLLHLETSKRTHVEEWRRQRHRRRHGVFRLSRGRYLYIETCCKYQCSSKWDMDSKHSTWLTDIVTNNEGKHTLQSQAYRELGS